MTKFARRSILFLLTVVMLAFVLVGCQSFKWNKITGGDPNAVVESNNGYAVKQGKYLYFINGKESAESIKSVKDNYFGVAVKGAIMRAELNESGDIVGDPLIVVPKKVMSTYKNGGITIIGKWIYYASPTVKTDNKGQALADFQDLMRTQIDGQKTQTIATIKGLDTAYKFTPSGVLYHDSAESKLLCVPYTDKKVQKEVQVAEEVTSVAFPNNTSSTTPIGDYAFYTKNSENEKYMNGDMYVVNGDNSVNKKILSETSYTSTPGTDSENTFTFSLKQASVVGDGIEIYYEKSVNRSGNPAVMGLFAYKFTSAEFAFDKSKEVKFSVRSEATIFPIGIEKGLIIVNSTGFYIAKDLKNETSPEAPSVYKTGSISPLMLDGNYLYFVKGNNIDRIDISNKDANAMPIVHTSIDTGWYSPEIINGKVYFINTNKYNYLYTVSLDTSKHKFNDKGELEVSLLGKFNELDAKAEEEKNKEKN